MTKLEFSPEPYMLFRLGKLIKTPKQWWNKELEA
jgi:hypothetical protein